MSFRASLRRRFLTRPVGARVALVALTPLVCAASSGLEPEWRRATPLPVPRTEVAAATLGRSIAVVGGYLPDGSSSRRVDLFTPATGRWRRLPDLPNGVNHSMAASWRGRLQVVGGYVGRGRATRAVLRYYNGRWRALARLPQPRAAAGAAVVRNLLVVAGGVGPAGLARSAYTLDLRRPTRWRAIPGPTPREHLAVTAAGGRVYAIAGRTAGIDTNVATVESWAPGERRWRRHAPVPTARGGTSAAAVA
jgi:hypothetical protein